MRLVASTVLALAVAFLGVARAQAAPPPDEDEDESPPVYHQNPQQQQGTQMTRDMPRLGIMLTPLTPELRVHFGAPENHGVLIARVEPGSPAARAGIRVGDIVTTVSGQNVMEPRDVVQAILMTPYGRQVRLDVIRNRQMIALRAMPQMPQASPPQYQNSYPSQPYQQQQPYQPQPYQQQPYQQQQQPQYQQPRQPQPQQPMQYTPKKPGDC